MITYEKCTKCETMVSSNDGYCTACWSDDNRMNKSTMTRVKLKARILVSIIATIGVIFFIMQSQPDKMLGVFLLTGIAFVCIFTITSILNIRNEFMRMLSILIAISTYMIGYYSNSSIYSLKGLVAALIYTTFWALLARTPSLLMEKISK